MTLYNRLTGKKLFHITTNHGMTIEEALEFFDIDWKDDGQGNLYYVDADGDENYMIDITDSFPDNEDEVELTEVGTSLSCTIISDGTNYYLIDTDTMSDWNGEYHRALPCDAEGTAIEGAQTIEAWPVYKENADGNFEILGYSTSNPN